MQDNRSRIERVGDWAKKDNWRISLATWVIFLLVIGGFTFNDFRNMDTTDTGITTQQPTSVPLTLPEPETQPTTGYCTDVTSYDYNWKNDMLCTRPDGTTFYTDYSGARVYEASD